MTLGEVLASVLKGAGQGAAHQFAMETRGPDYLAKEEALGMKGEEEALAQGTSLRDALLNQAAVKAAAAEAGRQGVLQ